MSLRNNDIIIFLESLFPLLKINIRAVKRKIDEYRSNYIVLDEARAHFKHLCLPINEFIEQFVSVDDTGSLRPLCALLESPMPNSDRSGVFVIDVCIVLTIFCRGSIKEKCGVLFDMYSTDSEHLTETQLSDLLMRIAHCVKKMRIAPISEMTQDDIKHIAFLARIRPDGSGFYNTLSKKEFLHWITDGRDAAVAIKFIRVYNRILDMVTVLNSRADKIVQIFDAKSVSRNFGLVKSPPGTIHFSHIIYANDNHVSMIVLSSARINIECHAVFPTSHPLLQSRSSRFHIQNAECCERYYLKALTRDASYTMQTYPLNDGMTAYRYDMTSSIECDTYRLTASTSSNQSAIYLSAPCFHDEVV